MDEERKQSEGIESDSSRLAKYERAKAAYIDRCPDATPEQYQRAMTELARRFGI